MNCPVCGVSAEEIPSSFDGKGIRCPNCGDYDIAGSANDPGQFRDLALEQRIAALGNAKRSAQQRGTRPMITTFSR